MTKKFKVVIWLQSNEEEKALSHLLTESKYSCLTCQSKPELENLITLHHHSIGLLIIDCNLTGVNVLDLCVELKQNHYLDAYLMVLGNLNENNNEGIMYEHGVDFFIQRPLKPLLLSKRIDALLTRKS